MGDQKNNLNWTFSSIKNNFKQEKNISKLDSIKKMLVLNNRFITYNVRPGFVKDLIARYYPLSEQIIEENIDKWSFHNLSFNENLPWSKDFISKYRDKWFWGCGIGCYDIGLSNNKGVPWTIDLINEFDKNINWYNASTNDNIPWNYDLILKKKDRINWQTFSLKLPWPEKFIDKFYDNWHWFALSQNGRLPWSSIFIEKHKNKWDWEMLSRNSSLPWNDELIENYKDKWTWVHLLENEGIPWTKELIKKYSTEYYNTESYLDDNLIRTLHITKRIVKGERINRYNLNFSPLSDQILKLFPNEGYLEFYCNNHFFPWTENLIEKHKVLLAKDKTTSWENGFYKLSSNPNVPWSVNLIMRYADKWNWKSLSSNKGVYDKIFKGLPESDILELMVYDENKNELNDEDKLMRRIFEG